MKRSSGNAESNHIPDICHACNKQYQPFKTKSESGMRAGAKAPCIQVPVQLFCRGYAFLSFFLKAYRAFLPADFRLRSHRCLVPGYHGSNRFATIILAHVKRLDLFGIVCEDHRFFKMFFYQVSFVFTLQINSQPSTRYWNFFLVVIAFFLKFQSLRYIVTRSKLLFTTKFSFSIRPISLRSFCFDFSSSSSRCDKNSRSSLLFSIGVTNNVFNKSFSQVHIIFQVVKGNLGFYHPEPARWRVVLLFSARKVGPKVYISLKAIAANSPFSCPLTVRLVLLPKNLL